MHLRGYIYKSFFESQRSGLHSKRGVAFAQCKRSSVQEKLSARDTGADKGQGEGQSLTISFDLVSRLPGCAYASDSTAIKALLTAQTLPLSEASMSRLQMFGTSCAKALADCILCCCLGWMPQLTAVLFATNVNHRKVSVLMAAQLPSQGCISSPVML